MILTKSFAIRVKGKGKSGDWKSYSLNNYAVTDNKEVYLLTILYDGMTV